MSEPSPGDALFSFYPIFASRPYLRRNVRRAIQHLTMGSAFSSQKISLAEKPAEESMTSEDEEHEGRRPAKRQKMNHAADINAFRTGIASEYRQPFGQVMDGNARATRKPVVVPPDSFYGRPRANSFSARSARSEKGIKHSRASIGSILPEKPHIFKESLRVDGIEVVSTGGDQEVDFELPNGQRVPIDIKCRCSVAIFYAKNDQRPGDVDWNDYMEISRTNKFCTLRIDYRNDGSISRKLILPEPFIFTPENFYVNRKKRKANGQFLSGKECLYTFGFADKYNLQFFIDPLDSKRDWPPLAIQPMEKLLLGDEGKQPISKALQENTLERDELHLFSSTKIFIDSPKAVRGAVLQVCHRNTRQKVQYALKLRLDWTLPTPHTRINIKLPNTEPQIIHAPESTLLNPPRSPLHRTQERASAPNSPADERAQRKRSAVSTYNLKALSAQAQGKSPRKSNLLRSRSEQRALEDGGVSVKYVFHKAQLGEIGNKYETIVSGLNCPLCVCRNASLDELRMHLQTDHSSLKFHLRRKQPRIEFFLDVARPRAGPVSILDLQKTFDMGQSKLHFNLEAYLGGDESWTRARHGPQNNCWPEHLIDRNIDSSMSSSPHGSRQSSPNTSADLVDYEYLENKSTSKLPQRPKSFLIPHTTKPLYDTTTKQVLQPGDWLSEGDSDVDETWLHHRKHELLNEFVDVTAEEKEYLRRWNLFMVEQHLTSDKFLPRAVLMFAETNKSWIMETESRKAEFMRHMEAFKLRRVLGNDSYHKCICVLRSVEQPSKEGKEREVDSQMNQMEDESEPIRDRKPGVCICGETPSYHDRLVCRGQRCKARIFHRACAENLGRPVVGQWKCDDCSA